MRIKVLPFFRLISPFLSQGRSNISHSRNLETERGPPAPAQRRGNAEKSDETDEWIEATRRNQ